MALLGKPTTLLPSQNFTGKAGQAIILRYPYIHWVNAILIVFPRWKTLTRKDETVEVCTTL
ncbi:unnamed protein product [Fusarium graminearum]|nr:unnamed protein product [Fusarium graminearum]CAG2010413.1 unnamed protein product [Fusarium graminearum]